MKKSLLAKIIAFILLGASAFTCICSASAAVVAYDEEYYYLTKEEAEENAVYRLFHYEARSILGMLGEDFSGDIYYSEARKSIGVTVRKNVEESPLGDDILYQSDNYNSVDAKYNLSYVIPVDDLYYIYGFNNESVRKYDCDSIVVDLRIGDLIYPNYVCTLYITDFVYDFKSYSIPVAAVSAIVLLISFTFLIVSAGHRRDENKLPRLAVRMPADLYAVIYVAILGCLCAAIAECSYQINSFWNDTFYIAVAGMICIITVLVLLLTAGFMNLKERIMLKNLFRNTLVAKALGYIWKIVKRIFHIIKELIHEIPYVWRSALTVVLINIVIFILSIAMICSSELGFFMFWLLMLVIDFCVAYFVLMLKEIKEGAERIADGRKPEWKNRKFMFRDLEDSADTLDNITKGIDKAVEERMKSERTKTALITNVSHDIKTPLTSIINYSDLICKEQCDNETITEYAEVLHRQSERLKKLIEDLIEASKASAGNIELTLENMNIGILLEQVLVEYEDKFAGACLEMVTSTSEEALIVRADGRRMWRVMDNLLNNACKYSMKGTRVYVSLEKENGKAVFSVKNISAARLNISAEELTERFARGDESRNAEGNGLGLAIAKDLVNLQGGEFKVSIDGDLFKTEVIMDIVE